MSRRDGDGAARRQILGHLLRLGAATSEGRGRDARALSRGEQLLSARGGGVERGPVGIEIGRALQELEEERREPRILRVGNHEGFSGLAREDDQARRIGPGGRLVEVAPHLLDAQARALEQRDELVGVVRAHALAEDLGRAGAPDLDLLLEARRGGVPGAPDPVLLLAAAAALFRDEAREHVVAAEGVAEKRAAAPQHALDLGDDGRVLGLGQEVAEAGEEVDDRAERAVPEGKRAHVAADEREMAVALAREIEQRRRVVEPDRRRSGLGERDRVAARAAAEIQQRVGLARQVGEGEGRLAPGRLDVAVRIEVEVLLAEPRLPPASYARARLYQSARLASSPS